jgi:two-component system KDP operon response regulator KdpE
MEMHKYRILVVDDEPAVIKLLRSSFMAEGWDVLAATDGVKALRIVGIEPVDLVVLDIMMPNMNGFEVCHQLGQYKEIAVIMVSARGSTEDKVRCLSLGADDYLTKPFAVDELIARVKSVLRRIRRNNDLSFQPCLILGSARVDFATRQITVAGTVSRLTPTECGLLHELVSNKGKVLTHRHLLSTVWGPEYAQEREYLRVFIGRLRSKLEPESATSKYIITVPGVGYQFVDKP